MEGLFSEDAENAVSKIIDYYKNNSRRERLGFMIDRMGIEAFKSAVLDHAA